MTSNASGPENCCFLVALLSYPLYCGAIARAPEACQIRNPEGGEVRALIIGIDAYQHVRQLKGAVADARDINSTLRRKWG